MVEWLKNLSLVWPKVIAVLIFSGGVLWTWLRPKSFIYEDAPDTKLWRDLRIWISIVMISQIAIYLYF
ncbi:hypothetical protein GF337_09610 [candidate division KSB1 bacterium]|nr:hypothetical protein [candidate division KSB1 bacterium]